MAKEDNTFPPAPAPGVRPTPCSRTSRPQPVRGNASVDTTFPAEVIWSASTGVQVCTAPPRARGTGRALLAALLAALLPPRRPGLIYLIFIRLAISVFRQASLKGQRNR